MRKLNYEEIKRETVKKITSILEKRELDVVLKQDRSPVSEIDLFVSELCKKMAREEGLNFYCEEAAESLDLPVMVLDPIDGTRELIALVPECAISLAIFENDYSLESGRGYLFNPFTGFELNSDELLFAPSKKRTVDLHGFVSTSEWKRGEFEREDQISEIHLTPRGSIAFKLGLLAAGGCDFVYAKYPKCIWDIAAGSILCHKRGFTLYHQWQKLESLTLPRYNGPFLWARESDFEFLKAKLLEKDKAF